jgi:two-component system, OmpR family, sensor histidine kinase KdpD
MASVGGTRVGRPSPDALLKLAANDQRGKLKVFLGAAPGVGKTYAMLSGAKHLKDEGLDVVIGLVETHGRVETAVLLEGLEILARNERCLSAKQRKLRPWLIASAYAPLCCHHSLMIYERPWPKSSAP